MTRSEIWELLDSFEINLYCEVSKDVNKSEYLEDIINGEFTKIYKVLESYGLYNAKFYPKNYCLTKQESISLSFIYNGYLYSVNIPSKVICNVV